MANPFKEEPKPLTEANKLEKEKEERCEFDVNNFLLSKRQLWLCDVIDPKTSNKLIKELRALDTWESAPIFLWINSPGGCVDSGFAIIDTIETINSPVITIINGIAASMAGFVSVAGDVRCMTRNSKWMAHDISDCMWDYGEKIKARFKELLDTEKECTKYFKEHTKLTDEDYATALHKELWLRPTMCIKKGIVDRVFKFKQPKAKPQLKMITGKKKNA